jgi:molybdenum cofactor cytidylyltransferase
MRFGPVSAAEAAGAVLAHSLAAGALRLKKGRVLSAEDAASLAQAGVAEVVVARLGPGDLGEDEAAASLARGIAPEPEALGLSVSDAFTGRVNLDAAAAGVLSVDRGAVDAFNAVDPAITLATLPDLARVREGQMVATIKIIPYAVPEAAVARALAGLPAAAMRVHAFRPGRAAIVLTQTPGMKPSLVAKGGAAVAARMTALAQAPGEPVVVAHETAAVAAAIAAAEGDMVVILGGSATSDPADVCPAALLAAGGELVRFGMPVDPGNLLFLGRQAGRWVVGLPGCARSPALNGADRVLERLAAGLDVTAAGIAGMGVGGLLKEVPARPQPRAGRRPGPQAAPPRVAALVLAAGASRRMRGRDKLLETVGGVPVLRRVADAAAASRASETVAVLPPGDAARAGALRGSGARLVEAADCAEGMAASLRAGLAAVAGSADAVVILLADMPEIGPAHLDRLIAAFDPEGGREIVRATAADGTPGHPVLFGRRFFEALSGLAGDRGAREVVRQGRDFLADVPLDASAAITDLDTPEAWADWRARLR